MNADVTAKGRFDYVLGLADDALVAAQRLGEWAARAPELEEDVALANVGLDLLGQARALLTYAGELEGVGRDEDDLAYGRDERDYRNVQLVERHWGDDWPDFAVLTARMTLFSAYQHVLYTALRESTDAMLAGVAGKAVKEVAYHRDHFEHWLLRLGDGTEESHTRMQGALDAEWAYAPELFGETGVAGGTWPAPELVAAGVAPDPAALHEAWRAHVVPLLQRATLAVPDTTAAVTGGRRGVHTEQMGYLLAEMQHLARSHPGATW